MMHARYLCKQIRRRFPDVKLVVGLWDLQGDLNKAKERIGCGATVVRTLTDAQEQIRSLQQVEHAASSVEDLTLRRAHPSIYPSHVDVRTTAQLVPRAEPIA
jgi:hypothetical protein